MGKFLFYTETRLVHGNYKSAKTVSEMGWGPLEHVWLKGPYGATGLDGDDDVKGVERHYRVVLGGDDVGIRQV